MSFSGKRRLTDASKSPQQPRQRTRTTSSPIRQPSPTSPESHGQASAQNLSPNSHLDQDQNSSSYSEKTFQRSFKACDACRAKKIKCDLGALDAPSEPPCIRCRREGRPCLFTRSTRGRAPKSRSSRSGTGRSSVEHGTPSRSIRFEGDQALDDHEPSHRPHARSGAAQEEYAFGYPTSQSYVPHRHQHTSTDSTSPSFYPGYPSTSKIANDSTAPGASPSSQISDAGGQRPEALEQYASVGLQNSRDALRVLAGVATDTRIMERGMSQDATTSFAEGQARSQVKGSSEDDVRTLNESEVRSRNDEQSSAPDIPLSRQNSNRVSTNVATAKVTGVGSTSNRTTSDPALKGSYNWSKFEPVRLKLIKKSEAKALLDFFATHMHFFAPHCSFHLLDRSHTSMAELIGRESLLFGVILSVSSRYCLERAAPTQSGLSSIEHHIPQLSEHIPSETLRLLHQRISRWTHERISKIFFSPQTSTIGCIEALLIFGEWATLDVHDTSVSDDSSEESDEDTGNDLEMKGMKSNRVNRWAARHIRQPSGPGQTMPNSRSDFRPSEKFDDSAWMLIGTAVRLAERLDLHNEASYAGLNSSNEELKRNAERRLRVWLACVHSDCHLSVRLGRRISSPGLSGTWLELLRTRTFQHAVSITSSASAMTTKTYGEAVVSPSVDYAIDPCDNITVEQSDARRWIAYRAQAELLQIVFRTCELLYRSRAATEGLLLDDHFVAPLECIRADLDAWERWTEPRCEPLRDMTSIRLRIEYHYARLFAHGIALDAVKKRQGTTRPRQYDSSSDMSIGSGILTHSAYPFVREALAGAQSLISIMTTEVKTMRFAPARWYLLLVLAAIFCVKATAVSDAILPLTRCAQLLQQVITSLTKSAPDHVHLATRYSAYLRQLAKQLVLVDATEAKGMAGGSSFNCNDQGKNAKDDTGRAGGTRNGGVVMKSAHEIQSGSLLSGPTSISSSLPSTSRTYGSGSNAGDPSMEEPDPDPNTNKNLHANSGNILTNSTGTQGNGAVQANATSWWNTASIGSGSGVDPQAFLEWLDSYQSSLFDLSNPSASRASSAALANGNNNTSAFTGDRPFASDSNVEEAVGIGKIYQEGPASGKIANSASGSSTVREGPNGRSAALRNEQSSEPLGKPERIRDGGSGAEVSTSAGNMPPTGSNLATDIQTTHPVNPKAQNVVGEANKDEPGCVHVDLSKKQQSQQQQQQPPPQEQVLDSSLLTRIWLDDALADLGGPDCSLMDENFLFLG
ncbi:hypothetical protein IE53DRAFT_409352 [Violaceomyces palustris]|uniref:Uncharacterized protein n=1 Tax=Violaceomyces palustris TaxID=1673888 RepID=A0ACD0P3F8_9BASI|nr:hypothetical protein IE53DRAFT_409352 [Violaceomyces palustris]